MTIHSEFSSTSGGSFHSYVNVYQRVVPIQNLNMPTELGFLDCGNPTWYIHTADDSHTTLLKSPTGRFSKSARSGQFPSLRLLPSIHPFWSVKTPKEAIDLLFFQNTTSHETSFGRAQIHSWWLYHISFSYSLLPYYEYLIFLMVWSQSFIIFWW